jgi:hypothetical protein
LKEEEPVQDGALAVAAELLEPHDGQVRGHAEQNRHQRKEYRCNPCGAGVDFMKPFLPKFTDKI